MLRRTFLGKLCSLDASELKRRRQEIREVEQTIRLAERDGARWTLLEGNYPAVDSTPYVRHNGDHVRADSLSPVDGEDPPRPAILQWFILVVGLLYLIHFIAGCRAPDHAPIFYAGGIRDLTKLSHARVFTPINDDLRCRVAPQCSVINAAVNHKRFIALHYFADINVVEDIFHGDVWTNARFLIGPKRREIPNGMSHEWTFVKNSYSRSFDWNRYYLGDRCWMQRRSFPNVFRFQYNFPLYQVAFMRTSGSRASSQARVLVISASALTFAASAAFFVAVKVEFSMASPQMPALAAIAVTSACTHWARTA